VRVTGIQGGIECAKPAPQLSELADGKASAEDLALLRPHMKTCLACRVRLREFREGADTGGVAGAARGARRRGPGRRPAAQPGRVGRGAAQHTAAALGEWAHAAAELATGQKVAAVAASAAALAGGGTAVDQFANHHVRPFPRPNRSRRNRSRRSRRRWNRRIPSRSPMSSQRRRSPPGSRGRARAATDAASAARPGHRVRARNEQPNRDDIAQAGGGAGTARRRRFRTRRSRRDGRWRRRWRVRSIARRFRPSISRTYVVPKRMRCTGPHSNAGRRCPRRRPARSDRLSRAPTRIAAPPGR